MRDEEKCRKSGLGQRHSRRMTAEIAERAQRLETRVVSQDHERTKLRDLGVLRGDDRESRHNNNRVRNVHAD